MIVDTPARIAIIGAGPVGLEAALYGRFLGYDVDLYERGRVCEHMLRWGHVRLFSPAGMNRSSLGLAAIQAQDEDYKPTDAEQFHTGRELVEDYFLPLSRTDLLVDGLHEQTRVIRIGREGLLKGESIGDGERAEAPFRILLEDADGDERIALADVVIDTSGTYGNHNWLGCGGIPARGERELALLGDKIEYELPDVLSAERSFYAGQHTLVIGAGYSAATTVVNLGRLAQEVPNTAITWVTRREPTRGCEGPVHRIPDDVLAERDGLACAANDLAASDGPITHLSGTSVESLEPSEDSVLVRLRGQEISEVKVNRIVANIGYRPDRDIFEELQVHECYATGGPMRVAVALLENPGSDCLGQGSAGPEALVTPEPNFYILGAKSYGRASHFLLATGRSQIQELFRLIVGRKELDLYASMQ